MSVYLPTATGSATLHSLGRADQLRCLRETTSGDSSGDAFTTLDQSWYSSTQSTCSRSRRFAGTLVAIGDSITDGFNSTVNANAAVAE